MIDRFWGNDELERSDEELIYVINPEFGQEIKENFEQFFVAIASLWVEI
jgi:hypothetical protein